MLGEGPVKNKGIAIIEAGQTFGGGRLQALYGFNSNSSSGGFLRMITYHTPWCLDPRDRTFITKSSPFYNLASEEVQRQYIMPEFKELSERHTEVIGELLRTNKGFAPIQLVGLYLSLVGNAILEHIYKKYGLKVFYPGRKATQIRRVKEGEQVYWLTEATSADGTNTLTFKSKHVVLGTGSNQDNQQPLDPALGLRPETLFLTSDQALRSDNFLEILNRVKEAKGKCKITFLGGNHSAFSVLYLLFRSPVRPKLLEQLPSALPVHVLDECPSCNTCPHRLDHQKGTACKCGLECACLSKPYLPVNNKGVDDFQWPIFADGDSVTVVTRTPMRVFFESKEAAREWNYSRYQEEDIAPDSGFIDFYTGVKAEARDLWKDIQRGEFKWVKFVNAPTV